MFVFCRMNLYELTKRNNFQGFSIPLIRRFAYSILQCLKVLKQESIIHCDLKPVSGILNSISIQFSFLVTLSLARTRLLNKPKYRGLTSKKVSSLLCSLFKFIFELCLLIAVKQFLNKVVILFGRPI